MNPILRNTLAVIAGAVAGGFINMQIIKYYPSVFPLPFDCPMDDNWATCFSSNAHLLEIQHLISIFLAHGLGTLIGAFIAAKIGVSKNLILAMVVGILFFIMGTMMVMLLKWNPFTFSIIDLALAYFPMAWLGWKLAGSNK